MTVTASLQTVPLAATVRDRRLPREKRQRVESWQVLLARLHAILCALVVV